MFTHLEAAVVELVVLRLLGEDEKQPGGDETSVAELAERLADARAEMISARLALTRAFADSCGKIE